MAKGAGRISLAAYAKTHGAKATGMPCWACSIPEAKQINKARRAGTPIVVIQRWLQDVCGYGEVEATRQRLSNHFGIKRHHEQQR